MLHPLRQRYRRKNGMKTDRLQMGVPNNVLLGAVKDAIREGHTATITVIGYSMRPFVEHLRDKVLLDTPANATTGDAVLAEITPGIYVLHRIIDVIPHVQDTDLDKIILMGDGNISGTEHCLRKNLCGKVTQYIRPGRTIPADNPSLIRNVRLWRRLLPVRRYLLAVYKAII